MSQTLYRKYRSQRFAELIGQEMTIRVLRNSLQRGRINHAYLMCGPRGTGKTSVARIFAKALNCPAAVEGDCCGVCDVCAAIAAGTAVDVVEMDAASNRGIDDVRELAARVQRGPLYLKRKVYIIDEVHMITKEGFNALLKTLEEPPPHVVFCLCTTDPGKLPVTILSRCIRLDFQRLPSDALAEHLRRIASEEGLELDTDAALRLASLGEGSARDAISLLDQLTVYCDSRISLADVNTLFQLGNPDLARRAADGIASGDPASLQGLAEELAGQGWDYQRFLLELAAEVRRRLIESRDMRWRPVVEALWAGLNLLKEEAFPVLLVQLVLAEAQSAFHSVAPGREALAESAVASRSAGAPPAQSTVVQAAATSAAARTPALNLPTSGRHIAAAASAASASAAAKAKPAVSSAAMGQLLSAVQWEDFWHAVHRVQMTLAAHILRGVSARMDGQVLELLFAPEAEADFRIASQARNVTFLSAAARSVFGEAASVRLRMLSAGAAGTTTGSRSSAAVEAGVIDGAIPDTASMDEGPLDAATDCRQAGEGVDRTRLDSGLELIGRQLGSQSLAISDVSDQPVSSELFYELFGAEDVQEDAT